MGTEHWPVAPAAFERTVAVHSVPGARGGLRPVADVLMPESRLVVPPARRRLQLDPAARDHCTRKHPGFCRARDDLIAHRLECCMAHFRQLETLEAAGVTLLRFYSAEVPADDRDRSQDLYFSFGSLRRTPKYTAMYVQAVPENLPRENDFPLYVNDDVSIMGQVPRPGAVPAGKSMMFFGRGLWQCCFAVPSLVVLSWSHWSSQLRTN